MVFSFFLTATVGGQAGGGRAQPWAAGAGQRRRTASAGAGRDFVLGSGVFSSLTSFENAFHHIQAQTKQLNELACLREFLWSVSLQLHPKQNTRTVPCSMHGRRRRQPHYYGVVAHTMTWTNPAQSKTRLAIHMAISVEVFLGHGKTMAHSPWSMGLAKARLVPKRLNEQERNCQ